MLDSDYADAIKIAFYNYKNTVLGIGCFLDIAAEGEYNVDGLFRYKWERS